MLLRQLLYRCEIRFLPVIASHWLKLESTPNYEELIRLICSRLLDQKTLPAYLKSAEGAEILPWLSRLMAKSGQEPAEQFEEAAGHFRVAGIEKILREKMWLTPISATEKLYYRGLIFRENRIVDGILQECYILPEDLQKLLASFINTGYSAAVDLPPIIIRPAIPSETVKVAEPDKKLPDVISLAAGLKRDGKEVRIPGLELSPEYKRFLRMLLHDGGLFPKDGDADPEAIRRFLVRNRTAARIRLCTVWRRSAGYDELSETPELTVLTPPAYDPADCRGFILRLLCSLETDTWWSINGLINGIKAKYPQFLRSRFAEGSWQINDKDGNDLHGNSSWFQLEGAYLRFLLSGPLQWLGITRLSYAETGQPPAAFRIDGDGIFLLRESESETISEEILNRPNSEIDTPKISGDGVITCTNRVPRYFRFMAVRYCGIADYKKNDITVFRVTPSGLNQAEANGLSCSAFLTLLQRFSRNNVPPSLARMLNTRESLSAPATIYSATILTIPNKAVLEELLETSRLEKWILQQINPTSLLIDPKGIGEIRRFLMEKEIFVDVQDSGNQAAGLFAGYK